MVNYLELLQDLMNQPHYLLVILVLLYFISGTIDFLVGTLLASVSKQYSTNKSQIGIVRKLVTLAVMILVIPLAMMLPFDVAIYSLTILYLGIVVSEIYSVLSHVGIVKDGDKHKNVVGNLFTDILGNIVKTKESERKEDKMSG